MLGFWCGSIASFMATQATIGTVTNGVSELRVDVGPGYRVYYAKRGSRLLLLLIGGDKSTQDKDIAKAQRLAAQHQE